jgi:MFS family permease
MSEPGEALANPVVQTESERPTSVRWRIVALLLAFSFMSWFNRMSMQAAGDIRIIKDYHVSEAQFGTLSTAFFLAYTLCMTPAGCFIDRFRPWLALAVMGLGSALFCALTGLPGVMVADGALLLGSLIVIRSLMGALSAPIYPASGRVVLHWIPFDQRARVNGMVTCAAVLGNASTYLVFGSLIDRFGWPTAFLITGLITAGLALAWMLYGTTYPSDHRSVNNAERALIQRSEKSAQAPATGPMEPGLATGELAEKGAAPAGSWLRLLRNRSLVLLTLSYAAVGYFEYASFFCMPQFLKTYTNFGETEWRSNVGVINLAMAACMPLGGWLSDRLQRIWGYRWGRAAVPAGGMLLSALFLALGLIASHPYLMVALFALAMGAHGTCEGPFWATAVELGGRRGGTSAGIFNTGGNALGSLAPTVTPWIGSELGWGWGLGAASIICSLGAFLWLGIDPAERVADGQRAEPLTASG